MPQVERVYTIPLRREYLKAPRHKRAQRAMSALRAFLKRHMKSETILLDQLVNEYVWQHGMKNPPHHIRVKAVKNDDGTVHVTLEEETLKGKPVKKKEEKKKSVKKTSEKKETAKEEKEEKKKEKREAKTVKKEEEKSASKAQAAGKKTEEKSKKETAKKTASKKAGGEDAAQNE